MSTDDDAPDDDASEDATSADDDASEDATSAGVESDDVTSADDAPDDTPGTASGRTGGAESGRADDATVDRGEFVRLAGGERPVVVRVAVTLDVETSPLAAYAALTGRTTDVEPAEYAFLLESAEKTAGSDPDGAFRPGNAGGGRSSGPGNANGTGTSRPGGDEDGTFRPADATSDAAAARAGDRHARYSFVGYDPAAVVTVEPDGTRIEALGDERYADLLRGGTPPADGDVFDRLRAAMPEVTLAGFPDRDRQRLDGGLVGFVAYDAVYDVWLEEVGVERPDAPVPDAQFVLATRTVAFDHREGTVSLVFTPVVGPDGDAGRVYDDLRAEADRVAALLSDAADPTPGGFRPAGETAAPRDAYEDAVRRAKEHVLDGDVYQAVVSRERVRRGEVDALGLYAALREINPSPYMYLLGYDGRRIVGASPETLVSVRGREVVANPIAGTCPRGSSPVEDRRLAGEMLADGKERAEHTMLVDLARNDVRRVSAPGSVRVEEFMGVLKYSHVQHIESTVVGRLARDGATPRSAGREPDADGATSRSAARAPDAFDATRAAFPAGTLAGAPKIRAMELIDELERTPRGVYGGGVGYYAWNGDADFAIVIRSATIEDVDGSKADQSESNADQPGPHRVTVRAGAGIVADSDPAAEYDETERKMDGVLAALDRIERGGAGAETTESDRGTSG